MNSTCNGRFNDVRITRIGHSGTESEAQNCEIGPLRTRNRKNPTLGVLKFAEGGPKGYTVGVDVGGANAEKHTAFSNQGMLFCLNNRPQGIF